MTPYRQNNLFKLLSSLSCIINEKNQWQLEKAIDCAREWLGPSLTWMRQSNFRAESTWTALRASQERMHP
ncbi:hypothetical protein Ae201684_013213 [Aphanomyces euteiches]|uniref:Uncharacterized protein n=1 Tax=Aphanomyces euteiches TaxID=100861 RepID=A0A6G0WP17_9STRA|nr:hypothetical protein Ae201684_013213 [Aphanomyces euteiches]